MHIMELLLLCAITSNSSSDTTNSTLSPVLNSLAPVLKLSLGLLLLAGGVLLNTGLAQALVTEQVTQRLLS